MPDVYDVRLRRLWLGLAAAVLVGTTATITRVMTARSMTEQAVPRAQTTSEGAGSVANVANRPASEVAYDQEIAQLRAVLNKQRPMLDTATIAVVEKNLAVIDEAIAQCTQALRRDPASGYLIESLHEALESKVQLLRTATRLASRS